MKITRRDGMFLVIIIVVVGFLFMGKANLKAGKIPSDSNHKPFYEDMNKGRDFQDIERKCAACHGPQTVPLSRNHPPKERCLLCHKLSRTK